MTIPISNMQTIFSAFMGNLVDDYRQYDVRKNIKKSSIFFFI